MCRSLLLVITDVVTCLAQVRSARKTFHSHGSGAGLILAVFCNVDERTVRCTDAAACAVYYHCPTARPIAACSTGSRWHRLSVISGAGGIAQCEDLRFEALEVHDLRTPSKYDDWAFSFKRAIRSSNCDGYKMLVHVERATDEFRKDVVDPQLGGLRMESVSVELYDLLCQACTGDALSCIRAVGRYARTHCLATIIQEVQPQDHGASHSPLSRQSRTRRRSKS